MDKDIAIKVEHLSKTFRIPHEKVSSVRGAFVGMFKGKRTYEEFKALDDVSFEVKKGEFFGIIGRNGSGKSTLLKILAGIYQSDKGKVHIDGMISPFLELGIGFNPELSGRDNVYLNATVLGLTRKQIDEKFDDIVKFSELERFMDQKLKNYSSGMQVRLAFSVSIHANRDILLMDEVLAVGDSNFQRKCLSQFARHKEIGKTVILVTHDMFTAQKYCDRLMLLRNGKIQMIDNPQHVGQEYVHQNILDEEERILDEEKKRKNSHLLRNGYVRSHGTKEIKISSIKIFDADDLSQEKNVLVSGKSAIFRIEYSISKDFVSSDSENIVFGLGVHLRDNNQYCFSINSFIDNEKFSFNEIRKGFLDIEIPKLILNNGDYSINAIISREKVNLNEPIHFLSDARGFSVQNIGYSEGLFCIEHYWRH